MNDRIGPQLAEPEFGAAVDAIAAEGDHRALLDLLREDHACYSGRGAAATATMRGWVLLALSRGGIDEASLSHLLGELDTGVEPYLLAAAARALRSYPAPAPAFVPFVLGAIGQVRYRDDPVGLDAYGGDPEGDTRTSPVRELLDTLEWLAPAAMEFRSAIDALRSGEGALPRIHLAQLARISKAAASARPLGREPVDCCLRFDRSWRTQERTRCGQSAAIAFEDQDGVGLTFRELFGGHPTIVVFFYTRCDNPLKCSLTVTRLAAAQEMLRARGLAERIHTAAITYDPQYDLPPRIRVYASERGVTLGRSHRVLRSTAGFEALREHFGLGVNFVESLVNRHKVEAYVLDGQGRVAVRFDRLRWDAANVVDAARAVLDEGDRGPIEPAPQGRLATAAPALGTLASLGAAFFPKCPMCWAAYLSVFGIAGLESIPYAPWLEPLLFGVMAANLASVWVRSRRVRRMAGFLLATAGAALIVASRLWPAWEAAAAFGVALTLVGSVLSVFEGRIALGRRPASAAAAP